MGDSIDFIRKHRKHELESANMWFPFAHPPEGCLKAPMKRQGLALGVKIGTLAGGALKNIRLHLATM